MIIVLSLHRKHKIMRAEPGTVLIIGGDFNTALDNPDNPMRKKLEQCNLQINTYQKESFLRPNMD